MEKFIIRAEDFGKLYKLCEDMKPASDIKPDGKFMEYLNQFYDNTTALTEELGEMEDTVYSAQGDLIDHRIPSAFESLVLAADKVKSIGNFASALYDDFTTALAALLQIMTPDGWSPIRDGKEINEALQNTAELTNSISIGYNNNRYAILFENENEGDEFVSEPFVFAVGREEDLAEVTRYFESLIDLEYEEE